MDEQITEYIRANWDRYTREAIRDQLIAAGHDARAVDGALAGLEGARAGARADLEGRRTFGRWALALHVAAVVAVFVAIVALKGTTSIGVALIGCVVLAVAMVVGWAISSLIGRALLPGPGLVMALAVPAVSAIVLGGACLALLNAAIQAPPRNGTVDLRILAPRAFEGSGGASCYVGGGSMGVQVNSDQLGTLDGKIVSVSLSWYGRDASVTVLFNTTAAGENPESFSVIFSTKLEVDAAPDALTGTIRFEGLLAEPGAAPSQPSAQEVISGSVSWNCE